MAQIKKITKRDTFYPPQYEVEYESGRKVTTAKLSKTMEKFIKNADSRVELVVHGLGNVTVYVPGTKEKSVKYSITNKHSRHAGKKLEEMVAKACRYYESEDMAYIQKTPEPMRVLKNVGSGRYLAMFEKMAQPDFKGCTSSGQCVVFDAKHTDKDRILQSAISSEQEKDLNRYQGLNAECFVLVSMGFEHFYNIPWSVWKLMKEMYGHLYMNADNLKEWEVPYENGIIRFLEVE